VRGAVDKIAVKAEQLVEKGKALVQPTETEPAKPAKPEPVVVERVPEPVAAPAKPEPVAKVEAPVAETPVAPKRVNKPARTLPPDVAKRRAEVLGEAAEVAAARPTSPTFMTPRVRRGELAKLAEDMELLFVEKVVR
jgi:hypothetical protein